MGLRKAYYQREDGDAFTMQRGRDPGVVPAHEDERLEEVAAPTAASGDGVEPGGRGVVRMEVDRHEP